MHTIFLGLYLYYTPVSGEALGIRPPKRLPYNLLLGCLALEQGPVTHPYHPPCSAMVLDCTTDQLHAPIVYEHKKVMKSELATNLPSSHSFVT